MPWPFSAGGDRSGSTQSRLDDSEPLDVHSWGDHETHIRVTNPDGFAVKVEAHARVDLPYDEVFSILTAPDNHEVFSSIVSIPYRKVLRSNEFLAQKQVAVDHEGRWKLGPFRGKIRTNLLVEEDGRARTVRFTLRDDANKRRRRKEGERQKNKKKEEEEEEEEEEGKEEEEASDGPIAGGASFMSRFEGGWRVAPLSQSALDAALRVKKSPFEAAATSLRDAAEASPLLRALRRGGRGEKGGSSPPSPLSSSSLVSLDHALAPSFAPPPPFDRMLFSAIAGKQVRVLIEDLRKEAERRRRLAAKGGGGGTGAGGAVSSSSPSWSRRKRAPPPFPPLLW